MKCQGIKTDNKYPPQNKKQKTKTKKNKKEEKKRNLTESRYKPEISGCLQGSQGHQSYYPRQWKLEVHPLSSPEIITRQATQFWRLKKLNLIHLLLIFFRSECKFTDEQNVPERATFAEKKYVKLKGLNTQVKPKMKSMGKEDSQTIPFTQKNRNYAECPSSSSDQCWTHQWILQENKGEVWKKLIFIPLKNVPYLSLTSTSWYRKRLSSKPSSFSFIYCQNANTPITNNRKWHHHLNPKSIQNKILTLT